MPIILENDDTLVCGGKYIPKDLYAKILNTPPKAPTPTGKCNIPAQCAKGWGGFCYGNDECEGKV